MNYVTLGWFDLAIAASLIFIHGVASVLFHLGIGRQLVISATRMCIQLGITGLILRFVFSQDNPAWLAFLGFVMVMFAGYEAWARQENRFTGKWTFSITASSIGLSATMILLLALLVIVKPDPWYSPRYALPFFGMLLGNTMTGVALGLDTLTRTVKTERLAIEAKLALGYKFNDAMRLSVGAAMRTGLMPTINSMAATGLVSLPGMMTGQILAGTEPMDAVKYQILITFLIAATTATSVIMAVMIARHRLTDERQRLRLDRFVVK